jgi:hypothetical protein
MVSTVASQARADPPLIEADRCNRQFFQGTPDHHFSISAWHPMPSDRYSIASGDVS